MPVTASHEEHHPGGNDEVAETQQALLGLRSGVTDPADDSSVAFYRFEYVLTKATRPYRLHEVESDEEYRRADDYNRVSLSYLICQSTTAFYVSCCPANSVI